MDQELGLLHWNVITSESVLKQLRVASHPLLTVPSLLEKLKQQHVTTVKTSHQLPERQQHRKQQLLIIYLERVREGGC